MKNDDALPPSSGLYPADRYPWKVTFEVYLPIAGIWVRDSVPYASRSSAGRSYAVRSQNPSRYRNVKVVLRSAR